MIIPAVMDLIVLDIGLLLAIQYNGTICGFRLLLSLDGILC